jgi:hypothetical protein
VFLLARGSKKPLAGSRGHLDASAWAGYDDLGGNLGIALDGQYLLVDRDREGKDVTAFEERLPSTWRQRSAVRGEHRLYRVPPGFKGKNSKWPGGELKVKGYAVGPGSVVGAGTYTIIDDEDPVQAPEWLLDMVRGDGRNNKPSSVRHDNPSGRGRIPRGERNTSLTRIAGAMRGRGMTESELSAALRVTNAEHCDPPLDEREVDGIAHSIARYDSGKPPDDSGDEESIELPDLLERIVRTYLRFVAMSQEQADALALYVTHTHAFASSDVTPYVYLTSPEKRSGKTRTLEVSKRLVRNPVSSASITPAALFRLIATSPTLLIDEVDAVFGGQKSERNEDLRALLNAGFERGAQVHRAVGKGNSVLAFDVFCPKMLAGLRRRLPDTVRDRCVAIELRRKGPGQTVERFRRRLIASELDGLRALLASWARQSTAALASLQPVLPEELNDRAQDVWEPLLAIADLAGGTWPERARKAARALSSQSAAEDESLGVRLLADIRTIFSETGFERIQSAALTNRLADIEESPWGPRFGQDFGTRKLASILRPYAIKPHTIREGYTTAKGYLRSDFADAWLRYLPP